MVNTLLDIGLVIAIVGSIIAGLLVLAGVIAFIFSVVIPDCRDMYRDRRKPKARDRKVPEHESPVIEIKF